MNPPNGENLIPRCVEPQIDTIARHKARKNGVLLASGALAVSSLIPSTPFIIGTETYRVPYGCTLEVPDNFNGGESTGDEPKNPTSAEISTINYLAVAETLLDLAAEYSEVYRYTDKKTGLEIIVKSDSENAFTFDPDAFSQYINYPLEVASNFDNESLRYKIECTAEAVYKKGALNGKILNIYIPSNQTSCFSRQAIVDSDKSACDIDAYTTSDYRLLFGAKGLDQSIVFALGDKDKGEDYISKREQIEVGIHEVGHILDFVAGVSLSGKANEKFAYFYEEQVIKEAEEAGFVFSDFLKFADVLEVKDQGGA